MVNVIGWRKDCGPTAASLLLWAQWAAICRHAGFMRHFKKVGKDTQHTKYGTELLENKYPISFHMDGAILLATRWLKSRNLIEIGNRNK